MTRQLAYVLLSTRVEKAIRGGTTALYGLVELAEDYDSSADILRSQKRPPQCRHTPICGAARFW